MDWSDPPEPHVENVKLEDQSRGAWKLKQELLKSIDQQIELLEYHDGDRSDDFVERAKAVQYFVLKDLRLHELKAVRDFVDSFYPFKEY
jgi:hypothetical protein